MTLKLFLMPSLQQVKPETGIGQIVLAQYKYLPEFGIEIVPEERVADILAAHAGAAVMSQVHVSHVHGLYWTGDHEGTHYDNWHHRVNKKVIDTCKAARVITVPSRWVGECFRRDMRIDPVVIGHGIELDEWQPIREKHDGYILWNKNRGMDVCDPTPAWELAMRGVPVLSTFLPAGKEMLPNFKVTGVLPYPEMKEIVKKAEIYLATTQETFGIGTVEAMAAGIPVLGYNWGGTADLVQHQVTGYLVEPGDYDGLLVGYQWLRSHRRQVKEACIEVAKQFSWKTIIGKYAQVYQDASAPEPAGLAVIITNHNYEQWVGEAIQSCLDQTERPEEIIVVDDGSTDKSREVIDGYGEKVKRIYQENQGVAAARNNGIRATRQPFIICLDADDRLVTEYISVVRRALIHDRSLGAAYTGLVIINESGHEQPAGWPPEFGWEGQATPHVPPSNCVPCAAAFRRSMWERAGGIKQQYAPGEDAEFWTRGLSLGFNARLVADYPLFEYRVHDTSASRVKNYVPIDSWLPWMRDKQYPMGAPAHNMPKVRSYARPAVSVIIPVGPGHAKYLPMALDSLLGQTLREWEVIVINDSGESLGDLQPYPFVRHMATAQLGAGAARNLGIRAARAPFVYFLDADDYLLPKALELLLVAFIEKGRYVFSDYISRDASGVEQPMHIMDYDRSAYLNERQIHAVSALVPTEWAREVGGFDEELPGWEEYDFYMKLAVKGYCGTHYTEPLFVYRTYSGERRKISQDNPEKLIRIFEERFPGGIEMAGCCGGNAEALLQAKRLIQGEQKVMEEMINTQPDANVVRLKFIGDWEGPVQFKANGRVYYGANTPLYKFFDAPKEDAEVLVRTGKFEIVTYPQAPVLEAPVQVVPMPEPPKAESVPAPKKVTPKKGTKK